MDMDRFRVSEEKRHIVPVALEDDGVNQVEQSPQISGVPHLEENGSADPRC
jgi:hypothetical protein